MQPMPKVRLDGVERRYGATLALESLSLDIRDGEFLTLLGPSGCGKTTTLRIIAGFIDPTAGRVLIDGRDLIQLPPSRRDIGMVFQNYALFPHLTVAENIAFGMKQRGASLEARRRRVTELLDLVQMPAFGERYPAELSGGQRQRVAIARAVAHPPKMLLMDEPLGALDLKLREQMQQELRAIQRALKITTLYVTHDQTEAMTMSDRIVVMQAGRVEQVGEPEQIYTCPASRFVASFVGRINFMSIRTVGTSAVIAGRQIKLPTVHFDERPRDMTLGLRPEHLRLLPAADQAMNALPGIVRDRIFAGSHVSLSVEIADGTILSAELPLGDGALAKGSQVQIAWKPEDAILLGPR
jgi:spermidine/putrescine transport system ATP-binding protein